MKIFFTYLLSFAIVCVSSCAEENKRVFFTINHADKIMIPIQLNDSITAKLTFDTGGDFCLDSTFVANNMHVSDYHYKSTKQKNGSAWSDKRVDGILYKKVPSVKIGDFTLKYKDMHVFNYKSYFKSESDGLFNIPIDDTTHVWELNFEHNYLEIHLNKDFKIPDHTFILPMTRNGREILIQLPIQLDYLGDTLYTNYMYVIDTGMRWDIALMCPSNDDHIFFENKQRSAVWTSYLNDYHKYNVVNARLFGTFEIDSLRFYTFDNSHAIFGRLIGYNFLKRFNVFFDMKNKQVGFQPIKNFQRILNPKSSRFHFSTYSNSKGQVFVKKIANYADNYYKSSDLREGDEIVSVNGKPYKDVTRDEKKEFYTKDTLFFEVVRNKQALKIIVPVNKDELQGE